MPRRASPSRAGAGTAADRARTTCREGTGMMIDVRKPAAAIGSEAFFVAAPAVVAGLGPWLVTGWRFGRVWLPVQLLGVLLVVAATAVLLHAFTRFVSEGRGTPAPVAPTE